MMDKIGDEEIRTEFEVFSIEKKRIQNPMARTSSKNGPWKNIKVRIGLYVLLYTKRKKRFVWAVYATGG
jgi:hypothetical protein